MALELGELAGGPSFGQAVYGLTDAALSDVSVQAELRALWRWKSLLVFRDCPSSGEFHVALGRCFGRLVVHAAEHLHVQGQRELVEFTADPEREGIYRVGGEEVVGWIPWHADLMWRSDPIQAGLLRAVELPSSGGDTGFMSRVEIYGRLTKSLQDTIEGLQVEYQVQASHANHRYYFGPPVSQIYVSERLRADGERVVRASPPVTHPLVRVQEETGRKYLNYCPAFATRVEGVSYSESHEILMELARYASDEQASYRHSWVPGELVLWDNRLLNHKAYGTKPGERRVMRRVTLSPPSEPVLMSGHDYR